MEQKIKGKNNGIFLKENERDRDRDRDRQTEFDKESARMD